MPDHLSPGRTSDSTDSATTAAVREVSGWVNQLVRTLKTCRLYDRNNPTVVRFREDLHRDLARLLERSGALKLDITSRALHHEGAAVYTSRTRDENLPATLYRDGIRALTFQTGFEAQELDAFLDQIIRVTAPGMDADDLVTLLWEQNLPSLVIDSVPFEGEIDGAGEDEDAQTPAPWPEQGAAPGAGSAPATSSGVPLRSDDWQIAESPIKAEGMLDWLEAAAGEETQRFMAEYQSEVHHSLVAAVIDVTTDALESALTEDRAELATFLPRVIREAISLGEWTSARRGLALLRTSDPQWTPATFFSDSSGTDLLTRKSVASLDHQGDAEIQEFLALAEDLGADSVDWLMHVLSESQQKRARRPLARTIGTLMKSQPERVLPWMSDTRWYVVRNAVHILGWIGGDGVAGYLRAITSHPEMRVRREAVAALSQCSPAVARPILLSMLEGSEPRVFMLILQQLSVVPDGEVRERLMALLRHAQFHQRSEEEQRGVYMALAAQGETALRELDEELNKGGLFAQGLDFHRQSLALCIARIGTPAARAVLQRGLRSNQAGVRKACEMAAKSSEATDV
jgi:HEAT repeat protein